MNLQLLDNKRTKKQNTLLYLIIILVEESNDVNYTFTTTESLDVEVGFREGTGNLYT